MRCPVNTIRHEGTIKLAENGRRARPSHRSSILKALQQTKRLSACDYSQFWICQILKDQHGSTSGGDPPDFCAIGEETLEENIGDSKGP